MNVFSYDFTSQLFPTDYWNAWFCINFTFGRSLFHFLPILIFWFQFLSIFHLWVNLLTLLFFFECFLLFALLLLSWGLHVFTSSFNLVGLDRSYIFFSYDTFDFEWIFFLQEDLKLILWALVQAIIFLLSSLLDCRLCFGLWARNLVFAVFSLF